MSSKEYTVKVNFTISRVGYRIYKVKAMNAKDAQANWRYGEVVEEHNTKNDIINTVGVVKEVKS